MNKLSARNRKPLAECLSTLIAILLSLSILTVLSTSFAQSGYYDDWGNWVDTSFYDNTGYYDDWGNWIDTSGYYDDWGFNGAGYYDDWGNWIDTSGYYNDFSYYDTNYYDHQATMENMHTNFAIHNANWELGQIQNDINHQEFIDYIRQ